MFNSCEEYLFSLFEYKFFIYFVVLDRLLILIGNELLFSNKLLELYFFFV